jgi:hypothetical protein
MLTAIRQWVIRTMMKSKGETGIVKTIPKRDLVELNTQVTAQRLMENGIDPNSLKNADQVENAVIAIENRPKIQEGIRSTPEAKVFDMEGKEIPPGSRIMGGKELTDSPLNDLKSIVDDSKPIGDLPPPGSRGGKDDIAAPFASQEETMSNMIKDELMKTDNAFSDLVKTTKKGPKTLKEREAEVLAGMEKNNKEAVQRIRNRKMVKDAIDNMSPTFVKGDRKYNAQMVAEDLADKKFGKEFYDLDQRQQMDLYDEALEGYDELTRGMPDPEDFAQGGRAGFKAGLGKRFLELLKPKPKPKFDEKRFREGPIDLDFLENIDKKDLAPFIRTRDTMGPGGYGMYDNFADMPAGLRAAELIKTIKGPRNEINYKAAELFLGKRLRGDESADELIQMLNRKEMRADGGRIGLKEGMSRRNFLKIMGGLAAIPIVGKFFKVAKAGKTVTKVPIIKTENVAGKPEWFDALVNKVIIEGDDVTKKFATAERQSIHQKRLDDGSVVRVTEDVDEGAVRVEYDSDANVFEDTVQMEYKKPLPDEGAPDPAAEFTTAESGPVGRQVGPDDYDMDIDEVGGSSIRDLDSDVSKLKEYATGKGPTMREIIQNKKRKDRAKAISEDPEAQSDAIVRRQGEMLDYDVPDDAFASGGIARMLGE